MNWLAHLLLSEPSPEFRIGNLLPDILGQAELAELPEKFQYGISQHFRIDAFTDSHPVVKQSVRRISPQFRRYAGILVDVFYDHILARDWDSHAVVSLEDFAASVYASFDAYRSEIPPTAFSVFERMRAGDWLCSYRQTDGIRLTLDRLGSRLRKPAALGRATEELEFHYTNFQADFTAFFPDLRAKVAVP
jgi:acyl carrier protein phosphodiesterase